MRKNLKEIEGERKPFTGVFVRYGEKMGWTGYPEPTILLRDIQDSDGKVLSDHIWFSLTKGFWALGDLQGGEIIEFTARVKPYIKGYVCRRKYIDERTIDYKLSHPTRIKVRGIIHDDAVIEVEPEPIPSPPCYSENHVRFQIPGSTEQCMEEQESEMLY